MQMRNSRSPSYQPHSSHTPPNGSVPKKYYTRDEVSYILKSTVDQKLHKIRKQLEEKQQTIHYLNQKLHRNDEQLLKCLRKQECLSNQLHSSKDMNSLQLMTKVLNDKLCTYWGNVVNQMERIREKSIQRSKHICHVQQERVDGFLLQISKSNEEAIRLLKERNNAYWAKVKEALTKAHSRLGTVEEKINNLAKQLQRCESQRGRNKRVLKELEHGAKTARKFIELKKSVNNVYRNFEQVLAMQQKMRAHYDNQDLISLEGMESETSAKCKCNYPTPKHPASNRRDKTKGESFVDLEYSAEVEQTVSPLRRDKDEGNPFEENSYRLKRNFMSNEFVSDRNNPTLIKESYRNSLPSNSPLKNSKTQALKAPMLQSSGHQASFSHEQQYYHRKDRRTSARKPMNKMNDLREIESPPESLNAHNHSVNTLQNTSTTIPQQYFLSSQSSTTLNNNHGNQTIGSFINFSMESKKESHESVRERLLDLIEAKSMAKPVKVYVDHISYLKNEEGNYLFDLKGNMFKVSPADFESLEGEGLLRNIIKVEKGLKDHF